MVNTWPVFRYEAHDAGEIIPHWVGRPEGRPIICETPLGIIGIANPTAGTPPPMEYCEGAGHTQPGRGISLPHTNHSGAQLLMLNNRNWYLLWIPRFSDSEADMELGEALIHHSASCNLEFIRSKVCAAHCPERTTANLHSPISGRWSHRIDLRISSKITQE